MFNTNIYLVNKYCFINWIFLLWNIIVFFHSSSHYQDTHTVFRWDVYFFLNLDHRREYYVNKKEQKLFIVFYWRLFYDVDVWDHLRNFFMIFLLRHFQLTSNNLKELTEKFIRNFEGINVLQEIMNNWMEKKNSTLKNG